MSIAKWNLEEAGGNIWSDEQNFHKRHTTVGEVLNKAKPYSYSETVSVNEADIRWKVNTLIRGDLTDIQNSCFYEMYGVTLAVRSQQRSL